MNNLNRLKLFTYSAQLAERELDKVESSFETDLGRPSTSEDKDQFYYPQFTAEIRKEAKQMATHYEYFYCLERAIRKIVADKLESESGIGWWESCVPPPVKENVQKNMQRELESGVTVRSERPIDYTTFGELGEIVRANWKNFGDMFNNIAAFTKIMSSLNLLRGPIAHCCALSEDEVLRLRLTVKDWFRLME